MIPEDRIGNTKTKIAVNYRKKQKGQETDGTTPTEKQKQELLILGISLELPKTSVDIFIEKIEVYNIEGTGKAKTQRIIIHYKFLGILDVPNEFSGNNVVIEPREGVCVEYIPTKGKLA